MQDNTFKTKIKKSNLLLFLIIILPNNLTKKLFLITFIG